MNTLRDELNETIRSYQINGIEFLGIREWQWVLERLAAQFLNQGMLSLEKIWLWDNIKEPYLRCVPENGIEELEKYLTPQESYFFIASNEDGKYWVLKGTGNTIISLLNNMPCFEYYITDLKISWLICENHHGVMLFKDKLQTRSKS